eukprot:TRINITY_DN11158_c0_g1_i5.p2 TRINITY_DN11158_c0_g1~~TRINITY_DN11158_c0_g1_i5.p2  ORF type:complete len:151 (-),score=35.73 TRINITY_DN11158_c0_g1_i5:157-609(-)
MLIFFFFFKQKTAYEMQRGLVGSEMCIRDRYMGYIIDHRSKSVLNGFVEIVIYICLLFNLIYAMGIFGVAILNYDFYSTMEVFIFYTSLFYLGAHIIFPIVLLILGLASDNSYMDMLKLLILPDIGEFLVFGVCYLGFAYLYKDLSLIHI